MLLHTRISSLKPVQQQSGFTLIELLIAMLVFAIMATLAYGGLRAVIRTSSGVEAQVEQLESLQRCVLFLERDFRQLVGRQINTEVNTHLSAVLMQQGSDVLIEFTRSGNPNPAGLIRSSLQRVRYVLEDGTLIRLSWDQVDHLQGTEPVSLPLLDNLENVTFKLLDKNNQPQSHWGDSDATGALPVAVEVELEHKKWGKIRRLIPVSGF